MLTWNIAKEAAVNIAANVIVLLSIFLIFFNQYRHKPKIMMASIHHIITH
jgi:hypothetical protein